MTAALQAPRVQEDQLAAAADRPCVHPTALVIFGATGDLARRKLLPAIYDLAHDGALPERFELVGVSHEPLDDDAFRELAAEAVLAHLRHPPDHELLRRLLATARHVAGDFASPAVYERLRLALAEDDRDAVRPLNRIFFLSTAPAFFEPIVRQLGAHGLHRSEPAAVRVVVEKPFGFTLQEARELNRALLSVLEESQVFRIDHDLGKETVQNMLAMRFANAMLEPVWNRNYIDHVQITVAEELGVEGRAGSYDGTGALRDLVQNHLLQLLCLLAMEPPVAFGADSVRNEKVKVLQAIRPPAPADVHGVAARGQYGPGVSGGQPVPGYLQEPGVAPGSRTETYAAVRLEVESWRWAGVQFYLRTGKRLARRRTEITVTLKPVPHLGFAQDGSLGVRPNQLVLTIQPDEGMALLMAAKIPGMRMVLRPVKMEFLYGATFLSESFEAYERLLLDAMLGDPTLFTRSDEVEGQWRICDPILRTWAETMEPPPQYPAGSQGPAEARRILRPGHEWRAI
jgi:glucose-6-phosphate 1-dehydrogenase